MTPRQLLPVLVPAVAAVFLGGCGNGAQVRPPASVELVDHLELYTTPAAVNFDDTPGADGLEVKVFLYQDAKPRPVEGVVEVMLFDGYVPTHRILKTEPRKVWRFEGDQLPRHMIRQMGLWGYAMRLWWGQREPSEPTMTVLARYTPPGEGPVRYSAPVTIATLRE